MVIKSFRFIGFAALFFIGSSFKNSSSYYDRPESWATKVQSSNFENLYKIDDAFFRCEQPNTKGMSELEQLGIKSVLNLRNARNDNREAKRTKLNLIHIPINTWTISDEDVLESLKALLNAEKPVVVHCLHGSDRTGCIVAAYRMVIQGWTKEEAINEFLNGDYGYHASAFKNILVLLQKLDVEKMKEKLKNA